MTIPDINIELSEISDVDLKWVFVAPKLQVRVSMGSVQYESEEFKLKKNGPTVVNKRFEFKAPVAENVTISLWYMHRFGEPEFLGSFNNQIKYLLTDVSGSGDFSREPIPMIVKKVGCFKAKVTLGEEDSISADAYPVASSGLELP